MAVIDGLNINGTVYDVRDKAADIQTVGVIEPEYILTNAVIYDDPQTSHDIRANNGIDTIVYRVTPGRVYRFVSVTPRPRYIAACFEAMPEIGSVPVANTYVNHNDQTTFTIQATGSTNYIALYLYNVGIDGNNISREEVIRQLTLYETVGIDHEAVLDALIYGAGDHEIREDQYGKSAVYRVLPGRTYTLRRKSKRARFSVACFAAIPAVGSVPVNNSYIADNSGTEITFTAPSTAYYMATYFYHAVFDTDTMDTVLSELILSDGESTAPSINATLDAALAGVSENHKGLNFVIADAAVEVSDVLGCQINGVSPYQLTASGNWAKSAVYSVIPGETYRFKSENIRPRFSIGCFNAKPAVGVAPVLYEAHHGQREFTITIPAGCMYAVVYFWLTTVDGSDWEAVLSSITVTGPTRTTLTKAIEYAADRGGEYKVEKQKHKTEIRFLTWNIGHFSMGVHADTDIRDADYAAKLKAYSDMICDLEPDIIVVPEYSAVFAQGVTKLGDVLAKDVLFCNFDNQYIGEQRHYSCNAMFSNLKVRNLSAHDYVCLEDETITDSRPVAAQDSYYVQWDMVFNGVDIHCVMMHPVFDTNRPDVLQQKQLQEVFDTLDGYAHVIVAGDLNTTDTSIFDNAGYDKITNAGLPFITGVDNILVKGLSLVTKMKIEGSDTLSDHAMYLGCIAVG